MSTDLRRGRQKPPPEERSRYAPAEIAIPTQYVTINQHPSPNAYAHTQTNVVDVPSSPKQIQKSCVGYWMRKFLLKYIPVQVRTPDSDVKRGKNNARRKWDSDDGREMPFACSETGLQSILSPSVGQYMRKL